ncbi:MAG: hypothetical protein WDZ76_15260 [Pseudohongiellaceae bacterium]
MNRWAKILLAVAVVAAIGALYLFNPRLPFPKGEQSAVLYRPGAFGVESHSLELVDTSRATKANGEFEGSPERRLEGSLWYPELQSRQPFPLIVYSHGFMSSAAEAEYLAEFLVPKGYILVAVNYPLSTGGAPGGPTVTDVINQAGDVSFIIDGVLARNLDEDDELYGLVDSSRIAAVGLSLGGLTTHLAGFHRDARDERLSAAVSIAGPSAVLERTFFETANIPFMMIAGSSDAIVPYQANAAPIPSKVDDSLLVTLDRGSHTGFAGIASVLFRWFHHPDELVCPLLLDGLSSEGNQAEPMLVPDPRLGISNSNVVPCTMETFDRAMRPAEQQMLTRLAVYAFLESVFAADTERRQQMEAYLRTVFAQENFAAQVDFAPGR